ncbi:hypothetical protein IAU60_002373 [Kwoniella sp. DSM 27419]
MESDDSIQLSAELSSINVQLINHGYVKKPLSLEALSNKDHNEVVTVLCDLLGVTVNNLNTLDAMAGRHRTLTYEYERLQKSNAHLKSANIRLETETTAWKVRCAELEKRLSLEESKSKELREEVGRGRKALEGVRVAASHETKKVQMKLDKALAQITKSGDSSGAQRPQGLVLLNPIAPGRLQPTASTQSPLLEQALRDLADIRESLQEEAEAFRSVVVSAGNGLMEALAASAAQEAPARLMQHQFFTISSTGSRSGHLQTSTSQSASSTSHPSIANARLQALIADVRAKMTEGVPQFVPENSGGIVGLTPEEIEEQKRVDREQEKVRRDLEDRIKDMEVELVCAKQREEEAGRVVEEMARKEMEHLTAKGELDAGMRKQREIVEVERAQMSEIKARLERERKAFETERQAFHEEKRQAEVDAVLAMLPATPDNEGPATISGSPEEIVEEAIIIPSSPGPSSWHAHLPSSPSPLSPHPQQARPRTPKHHTAGRRKSMKTPLSRLVLEKAVRQKGVTQDKDKDRLGSSVLGAERGRKTNTSATTTSRPNSPSKKERSSTKTKDALSAATQRLTASQLGKARVSPGSAGSTSIPSRSTTSKGTSKIPSPTSTASLASSTTAAKTGGLRTSTSSAMGASQRQVDLGKVGGIGPRAAAKTKGVWR